MSEQVLRLFGLWRWVLWVVLGVKVSRTKVYFPPKSLRLLDSKETNIKEVAQTWLCGQFSHGPKPDVIIVRPAGEDVTGEEGVYRCTDLAQANWVILKSISWEKTLGLKWQKIRIETYTNPQKKK